MPPKPKVDLEGLQQRAQAIYTSGGISSGESGYFYYQKPRSGSGAGTNSLTTALAGTGVEKNHQYNEQSNDVFDTTNQAQNVLDRMKTNLGQTSSWVGNDDLVFYVDTTDGKALASDLSNTVIGGGNAALNYAVDFKSFAFRGSFILQGGYQNNGPKVGPSILMSPPSGAWCPVAFTANPDFNGFLYIGGNIEKLNGTPYIYGSVDLEGNFAASGNTSVYYRNDFNYSLVESGTLAVTRWQEIKVFPPPLP